MFDEVDKVSVSFFTFPFDYIYEFKSEKFTLTFLKLIFECTIFAHGVTLTG